MVKLNTVIHNIKCYIHATCPHCTNVRYVTLRLLARTHCTVVRYVVPGRLELPTSTLSVWRSNQLSYRTELEESTAASHARLPFSYS